MPGAAGQLKRLYQQIIGGSAPSGSADASGDIGQMVKYLIANPGGVNWKTLALDNAGGGNLVFSQGFNALWGKFTSNGLGVAGFPVWTLTTSGVTGVWDDTLKMWYARNNGGAANYGSRSSIGVMLPKGISGSFPTFQGVTDGSLLAPTGNARLVIEWYGSFRAAYADGTDRGIGITSSGLSFANTTKCIQIQRVTGSGWVLASADGTTRSTQAEASDTSDNAVRLFRLEAEQSEIRLYVDNTLKATKSNNLPWATDGTGPTLICLLAAPASGAADDIRNYAHAAYYEAA